MYTIENHIDYPVTITQDGKGRYKVSYGAHTKSGLSYIEAATELGACVMHAAICSGFLEPTED